MRDLQWIIADEQEIEFKALWRKQLGRDPEPELVRAFMSNPERVRRHDLAQFRMAFTALNEED